MSEPANIPLTSLALVEALPAEFAEDVIERFTLRQVLPGEEVFTENEPGLELVALLGGSFELVKMGATGEVLLAEPEPGTVLGHISLIDGRPRSATLRAQSAGTVAFLSKADFDRLWAEGSRAGTALQLELVQVAIHELRAANSRLSELVDIPLDTSPDVLRELLGAASRALPGRA